MNGKRPEQVLMEIKRIAAEEGIPIVGPIKGRFLGELTRKHKPQKRRASRAQPLPCFRVKKSLQTHKSGLLSFEL